MFMLYNHFYDGRQYFWRGVVWTEFSQTARNRLNESVHVKKSLFSCFHIIIIKKKKQHQQSPKDTWINRLLNQNKSSYRPV